MGEIPQQTHVHVHPAPSNGLGTAAGICSILGLISCGILCPIGLVLGLMSMGKEPKGMALTGVILGAIGSFVYLIVFIFFGGALLVMCGGCIGFSSLAAEAMEQQAASQPAADAIIAYYDVNDQLPDDATAMQLIAGFTHDGHGFRYQSGIDDSSFSLQHPGDDGQWNTADDWETDWDASFDSIEWPEDISVQPDVTPSPNDPSEPTNP